MHSGRVPASCPPGFQGRYTVQPGDSMFLIAQRFGVSLNALIAANPHISNPSQIFPGDVLCVPGTSPQPPCRQPSSCPPGFQGRYTVQPGDSMFTIAQRFGVSLNALIAANPHISNPNQIFPCDVLCVPGGQPCREPVSCPPGFQCRYTVQPGDSMFTIAQRFGVSLNALIAANPQITNPNQIFPCDVLCVPCEDDDISTPCTALLRQTGTIIGNAAGSALIRFLNTGERSISVLGVGLPEPSDLGEFNSYQCRVAFPDGSSNHFILLPISFGPSKPKTWAGTLTFGSGDWPRSTMIVVRPIHRDKGKTGAAVLTGTLEKCCH